MKLIFETLKIESDILNVSKINLLQLKKDRKRHGIEKEQNQSFAAMGRSFCTSYSLWLSMFIITSLAFEVQSKEVTDFRAVFYEDLYPQISQFTEPGVSHFSEILFDSSRDLLIVGARDALFKLSLEGLAKLEKFNLGSTKLKCWNLHR